VRLEGLGQLKQAIDLIGNPSSRTTALMSTQPLTEMSTSNLLGGKRWPERKAHKFTAIYEQIV
jgi:hypothetical protein